MERGREGENESQGTQLRAASKQLADAAKTILAPRERAGL
jgi:hypothetical protein